MKPKVQPVQFCKKLRSKLPRRTRSQISPILLSSQSSIFASDSKKGLAAFAVDLREVSYDSSRVSVGLDGLKINKSKNSVKKRGFEEISGFGVNEKVRGEEFRRVTRSYYRQRENDNKDEKISVRDGEVELSESSCVESCSGVDAGERISRLKTKTGKEEANAKVIRIEEDSETIPQSEISSVQQFCGELRRKILNSEEEKVKGSEKWLKINESKVVSINSGLESPSGVNFGSICSNIGKVTDKTINDDDNRGSTVEASEISRNCAESTFAISNSESTIDQKPKFIATDSGLACSEHLSYEDVSDRLIATDSVYSDFESESFYDSSEIDFSDYTPSIWFDSGSEFSERSTGDTTPSPTFSLFLQYRQQFCRSTSTLVSKVSSCVEDEDSDEFVRLKFEDDEHEESYKMFRNRERRQVYLRDYAEEYCSTTEYGNIVIQHRLQMVHWIIEQSASKDFERETMFLGVSLLDRFLSKGFFKNKRCLQILGICCLTLATRIEENQPFNSVRQKTFSLGSNVFNRCEVVAMEWLVQEILNFQCFLPTVYNFLWFYLKAARANEEVEKTAKYLAVVALLGHEQLCYWPSTVAAGLVILASLAANQDASCHRVMETHGGTKDDDLPGCIKSLEWLVKYIS